MGAVQREDSKRQSIRDSAQAALQDLLNRQCCLQRRTLCIVEEHKLGGAVSIVAVRGETAAGQTDIVSPVATLPLLCTALALCALWLCSVHCTTLP